MRCAVNSIFDCAGVCNIIQFANKKEPAVADSYMKQCDLRAYFDEKRLDRVFLE